MVILHDGGGAPPVQPCPSVALLPAAARLDQRSKLDMVLADQRSARCPRRESESARARVSKPASARASERASGRD